MTDVSNEWQIKFKNTVLNDATDVPIWLVNSTLVQFANQKFKSSAFFENSYFCIFNQQKEISYEINVTFRFLFKFHIGIDYYISLHYIANKLICTTP